MDSSVFSVLWVHYEGWLSLYALLGMMAVLAVCQGFFMLFPAYRSARADNRVQAIERNKKDSYRRIQNISQLSGLLTQLVMFGLIFPFCLSAAPKLWWEIVINLFVLLMVYDFFYYLTHRFLFHDGPLGGPLQHVHAVHHRQMKPCQKDSNYLHPLETIIGLALYAACVTGISVMIGGYHVITIIVSSVIYFLINTHNHALMSVSHFPFRFLSCMSRLHHVHHARFTAGNFSTITLFYDWLFGTYDVGAGYKPSAKRVSPP